VAVVVVVAVVVLVVLVVMVVVAVVLVEVVLAVVGGRRDSLLFMIHPGAQRPQIAVPVKSSLPRVVV
jgi:hypothetical protein